MKPQNRYIRRSRISEAKFRQLLRYFVADIEAKKIAWFTHLNRNTVNRYLRLLRERIVAACEAEAPLRGKVEVDESYVGPRRVRGKRGRGAGRKTIVFGIFQRNGTVYTEIVPDASKRTLQAVIRGRVDLRSVIRSDAWRGYDGLVDLGYQKHFRVRHGRNEFARKKGRAHLNGIEAFWS